MQQPNRLNLLLDWKALSHSEQRELLYAIWAVEQDVNRATFERIFLGSDAVVRYESGDLIEGRRLTPTEVENSPLWRAFQELRLLLVPPQPAAIRSGHALRAPR